MAVVVTHPSCAKSSRFTRGGLMVTGGLLMGGALVALVQAMNNSARQQQNLPPLTFSETLSQSPLLLIVPPLATIPIALWLAADPQC
jgi:hypothetical protein